MGSDCFGAALQVAGLAAAAAAVACLAGGASGRVLASAVVIGCPAAIFLSLSAKPQLLPAAASTVALALFVTYRRAPGYASTGALWVLFSCVSFAAAS
jgi:hypothetical protein